MKPLMILAVIALASVALNVYLVDKLAKAGENIKAAQEKYAAMIDDCARTNNIYPANCTIKAIDKTQDPARFAMLQPPAVE